MRPSPDPQTDFLALARRRQSVRGYRPDPIDPDALARCLEAARLAPSACNAQPWTFVVVDDPALKNELADCTADRWLPLNHWTKQAPVLIVIVVESANLTSRIGARVKQRDFPWMDVAIAAEHICLQATAEGLGTCMIGWLNETRVKTLLGIPIEKRIGLLITLGHPSDTRVRVKIRKQTDDIIRYNQYAANT